MTKPRQDQVYFRPRNWERFQHYKTRQPPWIKLHRQLLRDHDFLSLTEVQQAQLMKLWLLYADHGGPLPLVPSFLAAQLGSSPQALGRSLKALKDSNFIELCSKDASIALAPCKQSASLETETEEEREEDTLATLGTSPIGEPPGKEFDPAKQLFDFGVQLLASYGIKGQKARALIGKWRKVRKDPDLMAILLRAGETRRFEIVPFVEGSLRDQVKRPRSWVEQEREASRQRMEWIRQEAGIDEPGPISGDSAERDSFSGGASGADEGEPLSPDRDRLHSNDRRSIPGPVAGGSGNGDARLFGDMAEDDLANPGAAHSWPNGAHAGSGRQADRGAGETKPGAPRFKAPAVKPGAASD